MWLALLVACGLPHRVVKSLVAPDYATLSTPTGDAVDVSYQADPKGPMAPYAPGVFQAGGKWFAEAVEVTTAGSIDIAPVGEDVGLTLWVRSPGLRQQDFVPVRSVTGGLDAQYANEVRFLPVRLNEPVHLDLRQLSNVYNDYELGDGDLLMVEAARPGEEPERYLFLARDFGPRFKYGGGACSRSRSRSRPRISRRPRPPSWCSPRRSATGSARGHRSCGGSAARGRS